MRKATLKFRGRPIHLTVSDHKEKMNIRVIEHIIKGIKSGKDLNSLYTEKVNLFEVPFILTKEIESYLKKILLNGKTDEVVASLFILSKFKKDEAFDFEIISRYLKKRDYQIGLQSILAFNNSNSIEAESILVNYILNPMNDSFGQDAVDILAKIMRSKNTLKDLIEKSSLIKGETKSSVGNLIFRFSFNPKFRKLKEIEEFLISKKMLPIEKYSFKGWRKSTSNNINTDLAKLVNKLYSNPHNKSFTSQKFYTIESNYYYSMYRIVIDHNPNTFIKIQFGLHPLVSHSWGLNHIEFGLRYTEEVVFRNIEKFNSTLNYEIEKWKSIIKEEIEILQNTTLDEIYKKSRTLQNTTSLNVHSYSGYINWLAFNKRNKEILDLGKKALEDKSLNLNETWIEYFKNLDKITVH